jgi:hypothetical protein
MDMHTIFLETLKLTNFLVYAFEKVISRVGMHNEFALNNIRQAQRMLPALIDIALIPYPLHNPLRSF